VTVLGEHSGDLLSASDASMFHLPHGSGARTGGTALPDGPLVRAMHRTEAESLPGETEVPTAGEYEH
jgi:hypothetical protein